MSIAGLAASAFSKLPPGALGWLASAGVALFLRELPSLLGSLFGKGLDEALAKGSPEFDQFLLGAVKLAEKAIPTPGSGDAKYKLVAELVANGLPQLKIDPDQLDAAIEKAVAAMEAEVDKREPPKAQ